MLNLLIPYIKYIKYIAVAIFAAYTYYLAYNYGSTQEKINTSKLVEQYKNEVIDLKNAQIQDIVKITDKYHEASSNYQSDLSKLKQTEKVVTKQVIKEVEKPIYRDCKITEEAFDNHLILTEKLNNE